jgi:hypothetical protein
VAVKKMKKNEKRETGMSANSASASVESPVFSLVYKNGNSFEVLPELIPSRKDEVWGYALLPGIFLAKKCGEDSNFKETTWGNCKSFAEEMSLKGKHGSLPSKEVLKQNWSEELRRKIQDMDEFLCDHGVDAETRSRNYVDYCGVPWCSEVDDGGRAYFFRLKDGNVSWSYKLNTTCDDRLAVAFSRD